MFIELSEALCSHSRARSRRSDRTLIVMLQIASDAGEVSDGSGDVAWRATELACLCRWLCALALGDGAC